MESNMLIQLLNGDIVPLFQQVYSVSHCIALPLVDECHKNDSVTEMRGRQRVRRSKMPRVGNTLTQIISLNNIKICM